MEQYDIVIIGAGAAGLMAAYELSKAGKKVCVLEARGRIGGRIHTHSYNGFSHAVESGAEFVHGDLPVTTHLVKQAGLTLEAVTGGQWMPHSAEHENTEDAWQQWGAFEQKLQELQQDMTVHDFLQTCFADEKYTALQQRVRGMAEGYDAADTHRASAFWVRDEWAKMDEDQYRIKGGYGQLMDYLYDEIVKAGGVVHLSTEVNNIHWQQHHVTINTTNNTTYQAKQAIITLPVGVLLAEDAITFSPPIPSYIDAFKQLGYGTVVKILLEFTHAFWRDATTQERVDENLDDMLFIFSDEDIPTWWTQHPDQRALLTGWFAGPKAQVIKTTDNKALFDKAITSLASIFKMPVEEVNNLLVAHDVVNWTEDIYAKGAYSYETLTSADARTILNQPIDNTLYFAGEALHTGAAAGTVEAALSSGKEVSYKI